MLTWALKITVSADVVYFMMLISSPILLYSPSTASTKASTQQIHDNSTFNYNLCHDAAKNPSFVQIQCFL